MVRIPITNRHGEVVAEALVDDRDGGMAAYRWHLAAKAYAMHSAGDREVYLHREILGLEPGDGLRVDHRNGNGLDCRRSNMRIADHAKNAQNVKPHRDGSSRFRGVSWYASRQKWMARVSVAGRTHFLGYFDDEDLAAEAASRARLELMPFTNEERQS